MLTFADRVKENATVNGSSAYSLAGATVGFQGFGSAFAHGARLQYCAESSTQWEVGEGTFNSTDGTISRDRVLSSSSNGSPVDWPAISVKIFCVAAAAAIQRSTNRGVIVATTGTLSVIEGNARWYAQQPIIFSSVDAWVGTVGTGSGIEFMIKKNGLFALNGSIAVGAFRMPPIAITLFLAAEDWLTLDVTQIGATTPGKNLSVRLTA